MSNLKQIGLGIMQYTQDFDETYPPHADITTGNSKVWPQILQPYLKSTQVFDCPSTNVTFNGGYDSAIGYGFNYWLSRYYYADATMAAIQRPAETVLIVETGNAANTNAYYLSYPSYYGGTLDRTNTTYGFDNPAATARLTDRHLEGLNVAWADGHVKWVKRSLLEDDRAGTSVLNAQAVSKYWWGR